MRTKFEIALKYVLENEGGYSNNPSDPGGQTNLGITQHLLEQYNQHFSTVPGVIQWTSVKDLTVDNVGPIYLWAFWQPLRLDEVPDDIGTAIMDIAVNEGGPQATVCAQKACGLVGANGVLGSKTIEALNHAVKSEWLYNYIGEVQDLYVTKVKQTPTKIEFLSGWLKRTRRMFLLATD